VIAGDTPAATVSALWFTKMLPARGEKLPEPTDECAGSIDHSFHSRRRDRGRIFGASARVDAAAEKAYGGRKKIAWFEVFAGQTAKDKIDEWLDDGRSIP
jgi:hypothetical protein